jgi:hypothetical protein
MKGNHYYYNLEKQGKLKRLRQKPHCHMLISVIIKERPITRCNLQENIWLKFNQHLQMQKLNAKFISNTYHVKMANYFNWF